MSVKKGLGRGLTNLIPDSMSITTVTESDGEHLVFYLATNKIRPNPNQPRKSFPKDKLEELAISIKEHGILQPLVVRKEGKGYTLIAGERRWRAAAIAGLKEVPVMVKDLPERAVLEIALIENVQRENLNPIEEAIAYDLLMQEFNLTQGEIGIHIGKSRTAVTNTMRLLKLPETLRKMVVDNSISAGHARALLSLEEPAHMEKLAELIIEKQMSVRETEDAVRNFKEEKPEKPKKKEAEKDMFIECIENWMNRRYSTKVSIKNNAKNKGKIVLEYYSLEELNRLLGMLGYEENSNESD